MDLLFWSLTFGIIGKVLLGVAVLMVHAKIVHEHKIDGKVLGEMKRERIVALFGIAFMVLGYLLELVLFNYL